MESSHRWIFHGIVLLLLTKPIKESIKAVLKTYQLNPSTYLYLIDESEGLPIIKSSDLIYPVKLSETTSSLAPSVLKHLCFMQMGVLHVAGVDGVAGLVKLIFEGAYPHIPASWTAAAKGLKYHLDVNEMIFEIRTLQDAIKSMDMADNWMGEMNTDDEDAELQDLQ